MAYATRADFGDALRDRRGWAANLALLLIVFAAAAVAVWVVLAIVGVDSSLLLLLAVAVVGALGWAWLDAAHRIAGLRTLD